MWKPKPGDQVVVKASRYHPLPDGMPAHIKENLNGRLFVVASNLNPNNKAILDRIEFAQAGT